MGLRVDGHGQADTPGIDHASHGGSTQARAATRPLRAHWTRFVRRDRAYRPIMRTDVWGTFSVRDHLRPEAFLREALLFDQLVIPYPSTAEEKNRWHQPDPAVPSETWAPDRLDELLKVLGSNRAPGWNGAHLVQLVNWDPDVWAAMRKKLDLTQSITGDPWMDTRLGIRHDHVPGVVEGVAAFSSEEAWRNEVQPTAQPPADVSAMEALVQLPRPLLLPDNSADEMDTLRKVVDLAMDPDFRQARDAYFTWFRDFIEPLRDYDTATLDDLRIDQKSLQHAAARLRELWDDEKRITKRGDRARWFSRAEVACMTAGTASSVGLAATTATVPQLAVPVGLLTFAGWAVARWNKPRMARSLGGATIFVDAQTRLDWLDP
jgi:hypothetical protein